jgi:hypothetical protein
MAWELGMQQMRVVKAPLLGFYNLLSSFLIVYCSYFLFCQNLHVLIGYDWWNYTLLIVSSLPSIVRIQSKLLEATEVVF